MCAKAILNIDPTARIVIISGYQEGGRKKIDADLKKALKGFIVKPIDSKKLRSIILKAFRS